jgi:uncharacterized protein (TIGR02145 family)
LTGIIRSIFIIKKSAMRYSRMNVHVLMVIVVMAGISLIIHSCAKSTPPVVTTAAISGITQTGAVSGGTVTDDGGAEVTYRGVCWSTGANPTVANKRSSDGDGTGTFNSNLTELMPDTYYYLRAYATNRAGTGYGEEQGFVTLKIVTGSVNDIEGNTYRTVEIGNQAWMAENLKTTRFNDNSQIPRVTDNLAWSKLIAPGYCWYNNDSSSYKPVYGAIYNWFTVSTGKICPSGWHVPTDDDWSALINFLGGESVAGNKLKEAGTAHWVIPNAGVTNETGFTALPSGGRINGTFAYIGRACGFWSATQYDAGYAWFREFDDDITEILRGAADKSSGFSVRCVKLR